MRWYLYRKVEFYPFDVTLVAHGYVWGKNRALRWRFSNVFFYFEGNVEYSFRGESDIKDLQAFLRRNFNRAFVLRVGKEIRRTADALLAITKRAFASRHNLQTNYDLFCDAYGSFVAVFQTPELAQYLVPEKSKKLLVRFGLDRDYAARQLAKIEAIYRPRLGPLLRLPRQAALNLMPHEVKTILTTGRYPRDWRTRKRWAYLIRRAGQPRTYWNAAARALFRKEYLSARPSAALLSEVRGQIAYPGVIRGRVYLALSDKDVTRVPRGAILVCSMTRYTIVPYLKRVAAIVTDQGGLTCHAAIMARELKVPTIIDTRQATDVFKTGDRVEVDAERGVIKKLG